MEKYVIIAGAGVSVDSPSEFPMAIPIINAIVGSIAPMDSIITELLRKDIRADINEEYKLSGDFLRFEMLMNAVSLVDKDLYVLDAIKNYKNPNLNHYNLAKLAIEGHYVFTPNFDDLIERAIYGLGYNPLTICTKDDYEKFSCRNKKTIPVFKLHGSYYRYVGEGNKKKKSKNTLQASLVSIISKNNDTLLLDSFKANLLNKCIKKSSKLLFVGYSGSDDFDIVPSLMKMDIGRILWINHNEKVCLDNVVEKYMIGDNGRSRLLRKQFEKSDNAVELFDTNTRVFLSELGGIKEQKYGKLHQIGVSFTDHIVNWSRQLTYDEKLYIIGKVYQGLDFYDKALELFMKIPYDSGYYVMSQQQSSYCLDQRGRYNEALHLLESLKRYKDIEKKKEYLEIIGGEAYLRYRISSNNDQSEKLFKEVLHKAGKKTSLLQTTTHNYALFLRDLGRTKEAMRFFRRSYNLAEEQGDLQRQCWSIGNIANLLFDKGNIDEAETMAQNGIQYAEMLGDHRQVGVFENSLANIAFVRGKYDNAINYCLKSIRRDKYLGNEVDSSVNELLIGQCYFEKEEFGEAISHYDMALQLFLMSDDRYYLYELLFYRIVYYLKMSNVVLAQHELDMFEENIENPDENQINAIYFRIAKKMVDYFSLGYEQSFVEDLLLFIKGKDNGEIIGFVNIVWYLSKIGIPSRLIGNKNIKKAAKFYYRIGNRMKYEELESMN